MNRFQRSTEAPSVESVESDTTIVPFVSSLLPAIFFLQGTPLAALTSSLLLLPGVRSSIVFQKMGKEEFKKIVASPTSHLALQGLVPLNEGFPSIEELPAVTEAPVVQLVATPAERDLMQRFWYEQGRVRYSKKVVQDGLQNKVTATDKERDFWKEACLDYGIPLVGDNHSVAEMQLVVFYRVRAILPFLEASKIIEAGKAFVPLIDFSDPSFFMVLDVFLSSLLVHGSIKKYPPDLSVLFHRVVEKMIQFDTFSKREVFLSKALGLGDRGFLPTIQAMWKSGKASELDYRKANTIPAEQRWLLALGFKKNEIQKLSREDSKKIIEFFLNLGQHDVYLAREEELSVIRSFFITERGVSIDLGLASYALSKLSGGLGRALRNMVGGESKSEEPGSFQNSSRVRILGTIALIGAVILRRATRPGSQQVDNVRRRPNLFVQLLLLLSSPPLDALNDFFDRIIAMPGVLKVRYSQWRAAVSSSVPRVLGTGKGKGKGKGHGQEQRPGKGKGKGKGPVNGAAASAAASVVTSVRDSSPAASAAGASSSVGSSASNVASGSTASIMAAVPSSVSAQAGAPAAGVNGRSSVIADAVSTVFFERGFALFPVICSFFARPVAGPAVEESPKPVVDWREKYSELSVTRAMTLKREGQAEFPFLEYGVLVDDSQNERSFAEVLMAFHRPDLYPDIKNKHARLFNLMTNNSLYPSGVNVEKYSKELLIVLLSAMGKEGIISEAEMDTLAARPRTGGARGNPRG